MLNTRNTHSIIPWLKNFKCTHSGDLNISECWLKAGMNCWTQQATYGLAWVSTRILPCEDGECCCAACAGYVTGSGWGWCVLSKDWLWKERNEGRRRDWIFNLGLQQLVFLAKQWDHMWLQSLPPSSLADQPLCACTSPVKMALGFSSWRQLE